MASKVVLISGASSGFGAACATHLAGLGHRVYGTSRRAEPPQEPGSAPPEYPVMLRMDVCDDASVQAAVGHVLEREGRLDVLVNNAGVGLAGAVEDTRVDEAKAIFETNFFGVLRVCRAALPAMRSQRDGLILNVSSIGGLVTIPFQGFYSASKYALESLSDALRMELRPFGVRVALIEPGDFKTGFSEHRVFTSESRSRDVYRERCERAIGVMVHDEQSGADPLQLAEQVARLVAGHERRARQMAGPLVQRLAARAKRFLPDRLMDLGLRRYYRI